MRPVVFIGVSTPGVVDTWRSKWPADELYRRGIPSYYIGHQGEKTNRNPVWEETYVIHATNQDVGLYGTVKHLRELGGKVWVQFDDDYRQLALIQDTRDHDLLKIVGADTFITGGGSPFKPRAWFENLTDDHRTALTAADGFIAATEEVADAYRDWASGPVVVIHNWIPSWITHLRPRRLSPPVVGWFGGLGAHRRDIEWLGTEARGLERFGVVGDWMGVAQITGYTRPGHVLAYAQDWQPWQRLYREIGRFSVGIVPVVDDAFNRPKSWIKPLEFAAMGVGSVVAPLPAYGRLAEYGLPVNVAESPGEMVAMANDLLGKTSLGFSAMLREIVREKFSIEGPGGDEWEGWAREYA